MNRIIRRGQMMLSMFTKITTGITIVAAAYISVFWGAGVQIGVEILWQILLVSAFCTFGSLFLPCEEPKEISKRSMQVRMPLYFLFVNVVVLGCGFWFEWFELASWKMVMGMEFCIILVFAAVYGGSYLAEYKVAEQLNRRLRERK